MGLTGLLKDSPVQVIRETNSDAAVGGRWCAAQECRGSQMECCGSGDDEPTPRIGWPIKATLVEARSETPGAGPARQARWMARKAALDRASNPKGRAG